MHSSSNKHNQVNTLIKFIHLLGGRLVIKNPRAYTCAQLSEEMEMCNKSITRWIRTLSAHFPIAEIEDDDSETTYRPRGGRPAKKRAATKYSVLA